MSKSKTRSFGSKWVKNMITHVVEIAKEEPRRKFFPKVADEMAAVFQLQYKKGKYQSVYGILNGSFSSLGMHHMTLGCANILENNPSGWSDIRLGQLFDCYAARFRHGFIVKDNCYDDPRNVVSGAIFEGRESLTLCHAMATRDDVFAHGFGQHVLKNFEKTNGGDKIYFYSTPFFPFALKLYAIWIGKDIQFRNDVKNPLGRYQKIFDNWNSPDLLSGPLYDICDLHCEESEETCLLPAFANLPYQIFPVEIMAIYRVRHDLGLETPVIQHPLLDSPLLQPPDRLPEIHNENITLAIERLQTDFPNANDLW